MSIFSLFRATEEQENTLTAYQSWRNENPDNPSDDDFYQDDDEADADADDDDSDRKAWWQVW